MAGEQADAQIDAQPDEQTGAQESAHPNEQAGGQGVMQRDKPDAAQSGGPLEEPAGTRYGVYADERGREPGSTRAAEGVWNAASADDGAQAAERADAGEGATTLPGADEPVKTRPDAEGHAHRERQPGGRPIRIASRAPGRPTGRRPGSDLGWLRWGLLIPVVGFTAWAATGIVTRGLNGSWRTDESLYRIGPDEASGSVAGHASAVHTDGGAAAKSAAAGNGAGDAKEPAWKDPAKWTDSFGDGTPDFLRLTDAADQEAFRQWFVRIADYQAMRPAAQVPKEIIDCASLLRYAYREALKKHDAGWFKDTGMEVGALPGEVGAWHYPETPLGAGLFRVTPGPFAQGDESDGAFAQFADAKTLVERNAYLVSRNVWQAEPGDLLFYRQFGESSPWHSMIVTRVGSDAAVVYDTGEDHGAAGELRRVALTDLLGHPQPEWRPLASNPNFLGVYRWNILRGSL